MYAVTCEEALSIATGTLWGTVVLLTFITPTMMDYIKVPGTFIFFAACNLASCIFFFFKMREIKGLTRKEAKAIYAQPETLKLENQQIQSFTTPSSDDASLLNNND